MVGLAGARPRPLTHVAGAPCYNLYKRAYVLIQRLYSMVFESEFLYQMSVYRVENNRLHIETMFFSCRVTAVHQYKVHSTINQRAWHKRRNYSLGAQSEYVMWINGRSVGT